MKTSEFDNTLLLYSNGVYNQSTKDRLTKGFIRTFPKRDYLGIAKNYQVDLGCCGCKGYALTSTAAKIYNVLLHDHIEPRIEKILRKN